MKKNEENQQLKSNRQLHWRLIKNEEYPKNGISVITVCRNKNKPDGIFLFDVCYYCPGFGFEERRNYEDVIAWIPEEELENTLKDYEL